MRATLREVMAPGRAVAGLVCLGWEDARAYAAAAEACGAPVALQVGPAARAHMPLAVWGPMLGALADAAAVPICVHLDHGRDSGECRAALEAGFTSVMYDGSADPFARNAADTAAVAALARTFGASCEGEIGVVGYADGAPSTGTDPAEAARFAEATGVDALAVSVGSVHLMRSGTAWIDRERLAAIEAATDVPLVIHGGSGVAEAELRDMARNTGVAKVNVGTELRAAYGAALRDVLAADADLFDRVAIHDRAAPSLEAAARRVIRRLGAA